jgi:hypothetical protein
MKLLERGVLPGAGLCLGVSVCDRKSCPAPLPIKSSGVQIQLSLVVGVKGILICSLSSDPGVQAPASSLRPRGPDPGFLPQTQGSRPSPPSSDPGVQAPALLPQTQGSRPSLLSQI